MKCDDCKVDLISTTPVETETKYGYSSFKLHMPVELRKEELVELGKLEKEVIEVEYDGDFDYYRSQLEGSWNEKPKYLYLLEELKGSAFVDIIAKVCPKCGEVKVVADLIGMRKKMTQLKRGVKRIVGKRKKFNESEERKREEKAENDRKIAKLRKQIEELGGDS